jgi:hypothetical protein
LTLKNSFKKMNLIISLILIMIFKTNIDMENRMGVKNGRVIIYAKKLLNKYLYIQM